MTGLNSLRERLASIYELQDVNSANRNLPMEGLRGFAVLLVFFVHYHALFGQWVSVDSFAYQFSLFLSNVGQSGVDLFFVLSGYLIYGAVIAKHTNYLKFMKRRTQRIYPTFLAVFAIYLILSFVFPAENKISREPAKAVLYLAQNILLLPGLFDIRPIITVAWSLSYEFFFYLLIPILVAVTRMRNWPKLHRSIFFIALALLYTAFCWAGSFPHFRLIMFISGILLYEALHSFDLGKMTNRRTEWATFLLLAITLPAIHTLSNSADLAHVWPGSGKFWSISHQLLLFGSFFILTFTCFSSGALMKNLFSWTPLRWLGNMSYSYYLIHGLTLKGLHLVLVAVFGAGQMPILFWIGFPFSFFFTLVSSTFLFLLVEKRFSLPQFTRKTPVVPTYQSVPVAGD